MKEIVPIDQHPEPAGVPQCGTATTPPCPHPAFYRERNKLIYQIAGTRANGERVRRATEAVDAYLITALRGGRGLARAAQQGHADTAGVALFEIELEADIEIESER